MKWEENVRKVTPYVAGEQPKQSNVIKLNTNECPYPPSPAVREAARQADYESLRLYPDMNAEKLVNALAEYYHVKPSQVFAGVGSDDVLALAFMTFFNGEQPVLFPDITYSFYDVWAEVFRIPYRTCPLDENFRIKKEDYFAPNGGIVIPNPNAPTALYEELSTVEDIIAHNRDVIVIIDEAYVDFAGPSAMELLDKYDNLLVVQTFSKARSMAGMRIGYAVGSPTLIKYLNDAKFSFNSYTMNQTSLICGVEAVKDQAYFEANLRKIIDTRQWAKGELQKLGFQFTDSKANFIFATHPDYDARELFEAMKEAGIYVRFWGSRRIEQYLRITVGTREEMETMFAFLRKYMKK